jgi:ABC-type multidrug transport system ATPase subunit
MSEAILNALMHLFAIVANLTEQDSKDNGRSIVKSFLSQYVNNELVEEYVKLFDNYMQYFSNENEHSDLSGSFFDSEKEDINKVAETLKSELAYRERIIVFLRLLELVDEDNIISDKELEFISILAHSFKINSEEVKDCKSFVFENDINNIQKNRLLVIEGEDEDTPTDFLGLWFEDKLIQDDNGLKHLVHVGLSGRIIALYIPSGGLFVLKYEGNSELYYKGIKFEPQKFYILEDGAIIKGKEIEPIYYSDIINKFIHRSKRSKIIFSGEKVEFKFRKSNNGIQPFEFSEESGQLIGIIGGSGVGKSTLLNVLNGRLKLTRGKITINEFDIHRDKYKISGLIGYVPQDDLLIDELTVYQNLYYNAKLSFGGFSELQINKAVQRLLVSLDLVDIKNLQVGNPLKKVISGGQRKRLNIALELMREPSILLIDEPTSGLSSQDTEMVINLLKEQANKGKLVVANIHQPSSKIFKKFDKIWILDKGGFPIYQGNPLDGIVYFKTLSTHVTVAESECQICGNVDPDQILQIVESKEIDDQGKVSQKRRISPIEWYKNYTDKIQQNVKKKKSERILPISDFRIPDITKQFQIFSARNVLAKLTNHQYLLVNFLEAPLLAFILAFFTKYVKFDEYFFADNKNFPAYLFMSVVVALFLGLTVSSEEIIKDRKILERESFLNLSWFSYINSKIVFLFLVSAIQALTFVLVGNMILEIKGMLFSYWLILFSTSCFANMVGLNISSGLDSVVVIYILVPFLLVPQILLSGVIVSFDDLHKSLTDRIYVPLVGDLMVSRWAYESLAVEQYKKNDYEKEIYIYEKHISDANYRSTFLIPRLQDKLEEVERLLEYDNDVYSIADQLEFLQRGIKQIELRDLKMPFEYLNKLNPDEFDEDIWEETSDYLLYIKRVYEDRGQEYNHLKDARINELIDSIGREGIVELRQNNHNKALSDILLNRRGVVKIYEVKNRFVQKKDPIYMYPDHDWGRSHFYAPVKKIKGEIIDTFIFNILAIWLFSFIMYIMLWADVLRKIMTYFSNVKLRRQN